MKWNKFRLKTTTEAEDIVSSMLADLGIEGVEIEDKIPLTESDKEQMFVDILPEIEADDGVAYLSFYLEEDEDKEKVLANVKKELEEMSAYVNVGACEIEESQTEDVDWVNNWKKYFHQFYVDDILIIPSWEDVKPFSTGRWQGRFFMGKRINRCRSRKTKGSCRVRKVRQLLFLFTDTRTLLS